MAGYKGANLRLISANRFNFPMALYEDNELLCELDEYEARVELYGDNYYADEQHSDEEDDAISGTVAKKARVEQSVTKCRVDSILPHTRKTKFMRKYQGATVYKSKFQLEWQRKWPCISPLRDKPNFIVLSVLRLCHVDTKERRMSKDIWILLL